MCFKTEIGLVTKCERRIISYSSGADFGQPPCSGSYLQWWAMVGQVTRWEAARDTATRRGGPGSVGVCNGPWYHEEAMGKRTTACFFGPPPEFGSRRDHYDLHRITASAAAITLRHTRTGSASLRGRGGEARHGTCTLHRSQRPGACYALAQSDILSRESISLRLIGSEQLNPPSPISSRADLYARQWTTHLSLQTRSALA